MWSVRDACLQPEAVALQATSVLLRGAVYVLNSHIALCFNLPIHCVMLRETFSRTNPMPLQTADAETLASWLNEELRKQPGCASCLTPFAANTSLDSLQEALRSRTFIDSLRKRTAIRRSSESALASILTTTATVSYTGLKNAFFRMARGSGKETFSRVPLFRSCFSRNNAPLALTSIERLSSSNWIPLEFSPRILTGRLN